MVAGLPLGPVSDIPQFMALDNDLNQGLCGDPRGFDNLKWDLLGLFIDKYGEDGVRLLAEALHAKGSASEAVANYLWSKVADRLTDLARSQAEHTPTPSPAP